MKIKRRYKFLIAIAIVFVILIAVATAFLESILTKTVLAAIEKMGLQASIESLDVGPIRGVCGVSGLDLKTKDGAPLLSSKKAQVNVSVSRLLSGAIVVDGEPGIELFLPHSPRKRNQDIFFSRFVDNIRGYPPADPFMKLDFRRLGIIDQ